MKKITLALILLLAALSAFFWLKPSSKEQKTEKVELIKKENSPRGTKKRFKEFKEEQEKEIKEAHTDSTVKKERKDTKRKRTNKKKEKPEERMKEMMGQIINATYGDFFKEMNLPEETKKALQNQLTENQMDLQILMTQLLDPSVTDEEIVKDQEAKREEQDRKMDAILSASEQQALENYQKEIPVKTAKKMLPALFNFDWENISEEKKTAFAKKYIEINSRGVDPALAQAQNKAFVTERNIKAVRKTLQKKQEDVKNPGAAIQAGQKNNQEALEFGQKNLGLKLKK